MQGVLRPYAPGWQRDVAAARMRGRAVSGLALAAWIIVAAVAAWGFTRARAAVQHSRLRAEMARVQEELRREIRHWQEEAARARSHAAQLARDATTWAAGRKQGRDDVIAVMPMLIAARAGGGTCCEHGAQEVIEHA
jgi:hypothetical protein